MNKKSAAKTKEKHEISGKSPTDVRDNLIKSECSSIKNLRWVPKSRYFDVMEAYAEAHRKLNEIDERIKSQSNTNDDSSGAVKNAQQN